MNARSIVSRLNQIMSQFIENFLPCQNENNVDLNIVESLNLDDSDQCQNIDKDNKNKNIDILIFQNTYKGKKNKIIIDCKNQIDKLCENHGLINVLVNDCKDLESHRLVIDVSDMIDINIDVINIVLQLEEIYLPEKMKSIYDSFTLMDFLMSEKNTKYVISEIIKFIFIDENELCGKIEWNVENILYLMGVYYKLFGYVDHKLFNKLKNANLMKQIIELARANKFDDNFVVLLYTTLNEKVYMGMKLNDRENAMAMDRYKILFNDLLDDIDFNSRFVVAGGSVNICLDQQIPLVDQKTKKQIVTDLDIFLVGCLESQKESLNELLRYFARKFGPENLYICDAHSIKYIWIADTIYHIQIIGTVHKNGYQVVNYFDLSHVKCWFDGKSFYKTPDCDISIRSKVSHAMISPLKKLRIYKTISRGYKIAQMNKAPNFLSNNYIDALTDYSANNYESEEVDKYKYQINNHDQFLPRTDKCQMVNIMHLSFIIGKKYSNILNLGKICDIKQKNYFADNTDNTIQINKFKSLIDEEIDEDVTNEVEKGDQLTLSKNPITEPIPNEYVKIQSIEWNEDEELMMEMPNSENKLTQKKKLYVESFDMSQGSETRGSETQESETQGSEIIHESEKCILSKKKNKYRDNVFTENVSLVIKKIVNNHKIAMNIANSYIGRDYAEYDEENKYVPNFCGNNFSDLSKGIHINSNFLTTMVNPLTTNFQEGKNDIRLIGSGFRPARIDNIFINLHGGKDNPEIDVAPLKLNIGYVGISNMFMFKPLNGPTSYSSVRFALLVNEQKYVIYAMMAQICNEIKNQTNSKKPLVIDASNSINNIEYDIKDLNVAQRFVNIPYPVHNKLENHLGNYLICSSNIGCNQDDVLQKYKIGSMIPITLRFSIRYEIINDVRVIRDIVPTILHE